MFGIITNINNSHTSVRTDDGQDIVFKNDEFIKFNTHISVGLKIKLIKTSKNYYVQYVSSPLHLTYNEVDSLNEILDSLPLYLFNEHLEQISSIKNKLDKMS